MRLFSCVLSAIAVFTMPFSAQAQEQTAQAPTPPATVQEPKPSAARTPRIGLALEGGGALGEAHIGVLKWFEEHHIPVDYIAGTSMGGLVGGLYATGQSADNLRMIVEKANWPLLLGGGTPYEDLIFRRKEDARQIPNTLVVGLKNGLTLPPGLNTGHQINLLIDRETIPYASMDSFNDLPIPFRCVSTELISGKPYVFAKGTLSDALRSTISIPGVFDPVRSGDKIFVDGGLVDNLPTDVVRQMGADVIIAVHLQISKTSAKDIQSAFGVLGRSVELVIAETELRGMAGADLIIRADVEKFSTMDYEKSEQLIQKGYEAAEAKAQILKMYSLNDADWAEYLRWKKSRVRKITGAPQFVKVTGVDERAVANMEKFFHPLLGKPLNSEQFDGLLTRLTGVGRYDSITYDLIQENGEEGLLIRVHEKGYAPPMLKPFVVVDGAQTDDVLFTMGARLTFMDVAGYRSEWRTDLSFGETYGIATELFKPITPFSRWFVMPILDASQGTFNIYHKSDPRAVYRRDNILGGSYLGYLFNRFNELRVGYGIGYQSSELRLGQPQYSSYAGRVGVTQIRYVRDHTNEAIIPTDGHYLQADFRWYDNAPGPGKLFRHWKFWPPITIPLPRKAHFTLLRVEARRLAIATPARRNISWALPAF